MAITFALIQMLEKVSRCHFCFSRMACRARNRRRNHRRCLALALTLTLALAQLARAISAARRHRVKKGELCVVWDDVRESMC